MTLVGNRVVESYVEQAIFSTPGIGAGEQARLRRLRRNLDREPMQCAEEFRTLPNAAGARSLLGVTMVLPPGHQELTRRATPTTIVPVEQPLPPLDLGSAPFDVAVTAPEPPAPPTDALLHTAFDAIQRRQGGTFAEWEDWEWISDFGDPVAEHHAVREAVGIWDESPLQKWAFRGPDALAAADFCFANNMASLEVGQCRYGPFVDERGKMLGDGVVFNPGEHRDGLLVVTALPSDVDHFRRITQGTFDIEITDETMTSPHLQVQGPRSRELLASMTDADVAGLRYFRFLPEPITIGGVPGCTLARTGYSGELGYEIYCAPEHAERLWQALLDQGAALGIRPYGLAAVESLRIEAGLIFIGFDYFQGATSPFHVNLDRTINLETGDFFGKQALQQELAAGITHRMTTLGDRRRGGTRLQRRRLPPRPHGRQAAVAVGGPLPDRRQADRDGVHRGRSRRAGHPRRGGAARRQAGGGVRRRLPDLRPGEEAAEVVRSTQRPQRSGGLAVRWRTSCETRNACTT